MKNKCPQCAAVIPANARFCPECGFELGVITKSAPKPAKARQSKNWNIIYVVALLAVIVVGIYGYQYIAPPATVNPHVHEEQSEPVNMPEMDLAELERLQQAAADNPQSIDANVALANYLFDNQRHRQALA
ncbi:MAG: zinc ribbon domain-containing protein, partial [Calditrichia bacterium]